MNPESETGASHTSLAEALKGSHWALLVVVLLLLVPLSLHDYRLFHTLAEAVSVVIAMAAFAVAWSAYRFSRNHFLMYLGIVLFWSGALDLGHLLLHKGMNIFEKGGANPAAQIWMAAGYVQAAGFLTAPLFLSHRLNRLNAFALFGGIAGGLSAAVIAGVFPIAYIEGAGRTAFVVSSEYLVIALLGVSVVVLWLRRSLLERGVLLKTACAIVLLMVAELAFTPHVHGISDLTGHMLKVTGYWLLYCAIAGCVLKEP